MDKKEITLALTEREAAFIAICRRVGEGYIEGVGISEGQPAVLKGVVQRLDLKRPEERAAAISGKIVLIDIEAKSPK